MEIVKPSFQILDDINPNVMLAKIEHAFRLCYQSDAKKDIFDDYTPEFIRSKLDIGHESPIEHVTVTAEIICDRGVTHEIVRHRLASYSQESTRYCNYGNGRLKVIEPGFWNPESPIFSGNPNAEKLIMLWRAHQNITESTYNTMIEMGASPQEARSILSNSTKTQIIVTMNLREWRHFFKLRAVGTTGKPHPQMREIAIDGLNQFKRLIPIIFDDLNASF